MAYKHRRDQQKASNSWYSRNKERHKQNVRKNDAVYTERNRNFITEYLKLRHCVDCGFSDMRALDFDHVRGTKTKSISVMVNGCYTIDAIQAEIAKCEVRCANCHRIITVIRRQNGPVA